MLSFVKRSSGSCESASEMSDQTVAQCQDKLQKLLFIMCSCGVSGPTSISQSFLRAFLKLCSNSVHFKKRQSIEQAFSKCQEHNTGHVVGALKSTLPTVSAQISAISAWRHDFWGKHETICPVFKNHTCSLFFHRFLPRKLSTNTVFLLSRDLLTVSSIHRSEVENATFWSAKKHKKYFLAKIFFAAVFHTFWIIEKREKIFVSEAL